MLEPLYPEWFVNRVNAYPQLTDLADALVHQQMGDGGAALQIYLQKCIDVKNTYPKIV